MDTQVAEGFLLQVGETTSEIDRGSLGELGVSAWRGGGVPYATPLLALF